MNFEIASTEWVKVNEWIKKHDAEKHEGKRPYAGACGGGITYEITPTSLGTAVGVRCMCGEKGECTDFDLWG